MRESLLDELRRYVRFDGDDERALRALHPLAAPHFAAIAQLFYDRILEHEAARKALHKGERSVGQLKVTLARWLDELLLGPWDEAYFERRCRIGRAHVRIALPQHYMFAAMDVIRMELIRIADAGYAQQTAERRGAVLAVDKILDIELGITLDAYREDLLERQGRRFQEKLGAMRTLTAGLSHEIRNPLNAAKLQLEVLERMLRRLPAEAQGDLLEPVTLVQDEIGRLDHLLEDFLQFARPVRLVPIPVGAKQLVDKVLDLLAGEAERRGVRVERDVQTDAAIAGDEARLRQALMNLTLNALEAVGPDGVIRVSAAATPQEVVLTVEDNGSGIPAELHERVFEPFFTTKPSGSGLGLPILQAIAMQHGGSIALEDADGGGARFVVRLPRAG